MSKEAMKLALDALIAATPVKAKDPYMQAAAIVALEEALTKMAEQPAQQEPVGYVCFEGDEVVWTGDPPESGTLLYTTPQAQPAQRTWVGLTKDEVEMLSYKADGNTWTAVELAEAKLKEKNT